MCGRFVLFDEAENEELRRIVDEINQRLKDVEAAPKLKTGEIFPSDNVPILVAKNGKQSAHPAKWGFPNFNKPGVIINARSESLEEKPLFQQSFHRRRCLVPASGYFEWKKDNKVKFLIRTEYPLIYMAGLYGIYRDKNANPYTGFVIITTEPSPAIAHIHNRMPVLLSRDQADMWLNSNEYKRLLIPYTGDLKLSVA